LLGQSFGRHAPTILAGIAEVNSGATAARRTPWYTAGWRRRHLYMSARYRPGAPFPACPYSRCRAGIRPTCSSAPSPAASRRAASALGDRIYWTQSTRPKPVKFNTVGARLRMGIRLCVRVMRERSA
jgi:hypothetical protein